LFLTFELNIPTNIRDPAAIVFNHEIQRDLMYLHGKSVFHTVDVAASFSAAKFLLAQDVSFVIEYFITGWATLYIGFPECILADQGSLVMDTHWKTACELSNIHFRETSTEYHKSIGFGERFQSPLRMTFIACWARGGTVRRLFLESKGYKSR
jgi:hypothetical protein